MGRPKTRSKPKAGGHRVKIIKDDEGKELVSVQGHTGEDVPPGKALAIMEAHVAGMPATRIARAYNTSYHTVIALIRNRPGVSAAMECARGRSSALRASPGAG
jgi:hypothetical protein